MTQFASPIAAAALVLASVLSASAESAPVVVELYTSQGCSSCPAADEILADLAKRKDVIALALHVDYWDYIGWKDDFAQPLFSARQRGYAAMSNQRMVYTPQMIFNGHEHTEGAGPARILDAIAEARIADAPPVTLSRTGDSLRIRVPAARFDEPVKVQLFRFEPSETVKILRGENRGKTLSYANIVTEWTILDTWDGKAPLDITAATPGEEGIAVVLQYAGPGEVVTAAQLR